jgi:transcriptional regulator with XRE-family HTH domain
LLLLNAHHINENMIKINDQLKNLNRRIAELRIEAGLTQEQLAEKLGVPLRALQYWEADRIISLRHLIKLAQTLGRNPADFFETPKSKPVKKGRPVKKRTANHSPTKPPKHSKTSGQA